jgi:hypothetical protein
MQPGSVELGAWFFSGKELANQKFLAQAGPFPSNPSNIVSPGVVQFEFVSAAMNKT